MRRTVSYLAAWFLAGVVAVSLASAGVSMVGEQVTDSSRKAPLSAEQVREELAADAATTTTTTSVAPTTTTEASTTTVAPGGSPSSGSPGPSGGEAATTSTTPAPPPPPPRAAASTKTYNLVGGTATLRFSSTGVAIVAAVPNAGFSAKVSSAHDNGARVEFESADHRSRVDGWWDGAPRDEVREDD